MPDVLCDGRTVELRPHRGKLVGTAEDIEIELGQWFVLLNGVHVGYLRYEPGSVLVWLEELSEADVAVIATACEGLNGWRPGSGAVPQRMTLEEDE